MRCFTAKSKRQAEDVLDRTRERFQACKLELHPGKTRIVYCKDSNRDRGSPRHPVHVSRLHVPAPQGGGQVRPRLRELLAGRQPRRPQGDAADDQGMAPATEERQELGRPIPTLPLILDPIFRDDSRISPEEIGAGGNRCHQAPLLGL